MPHPKYRTITNWKSRGLIYDDYDELYEIYIKTMKCQYCNKEFNNSHDRCMDHDHDTGLFRKIICRRCNNQDCYIKYPNGYDGKLYRQKYYEDNKEELTKKMGKKITCICGSVIRKDYKSKHLKSQLHLKNMDKYMENID